MCSTGPCCAVTRIERRSRVFMSILIFHSPMPIERPLDSGSAVRPKRMLEAFRAIGQEVLLVDGD